jgi:hypothetical protein
MPLATSVTNPILSTYQSKPAKKIATDCGKRDKKERKRL